MKRMFGLLLVLALPATFLVGCGGSDSADNKSSDNRATTTVAAGEQSPSGGSTSKTTTTEGGSSGGSGGGHMTVDEFCSKTKELGDLVQQARNDPTSAAAKKATDLSKELATEAQSLGSEFVKNPSLAQQYAKCAAELGNAARGG